MRQGAKIENASLTQTGLLVGTLSYMAEQVAGKKIDYRADIFALGSVFYELLTHEKPFRGDVPTILYKIVNEEPVAPSLINPAVPGSIEAIIRQALAKDPNQRFLKCEAMRNAFIEQAALLGIIPPTSLPVSSALPLAAPPSPAALQTRNRASASLPARRIWPSVVAGLVLAAMGKIGWTLYGNSNTDPLPVLKKLVSMIHRPSWSWERPDPGAKHRDLATSQHRVSASDQTNSKGTVNAAPTTETRSVIRGPGVPNKAEQEHSRTAGANTVPASADSQQLGRDDSSNRPSPTAGASSSVATTSTPSISPDTNASASQSASEKPPLPPSTAAVQQSSDTNQHVAAPSTEKAAQQDPATVPAPLRNDKIKPSATPFVNKTTKPLEPALTANAVPGDPDPGGTRTISELLRRADAATGRREYRLARYDYNLVLRLDPGNVTARAGLHRLKLAEQSH